MMIRFRTLSASLVFSALFLAVSACASAPKQKIDFSSANRALIHKIALLQINPPNNISVRPNYTATRGGGSDLIGGIATSVENKQIQKKSTRYSEEMQKKNVSVAPKLLDALQRELRRDGYEVIYLDNQRPNQKAGKKKVNYSKIKTDADAILNVYYGPVGYLSRTVADSYAPWVVIGVCLVDARTQEILYYKDLSVSCVADRINNPFIEGMFPDSKYSYGSFEDLMGKFDESVEGLLNSQEKIAAVIGEQLR